MNKPYLKKIDTISKFDVWRVDGKYIRDNINQEFTNFGQHFHYKFIPKWEFWIDQEFSLGEEKFFIDHLLVEWRLMNEGQPYQTAKLQADKVEQKERSASSRKIFEKNTSKNIPSKIYRRQIENISGLADIWIINGELVRDLFFIDFTEGGHGYVYNFIPQKEIWIDDDLAPNEREYIILHELHERRLMIEGWKYEPAHRSASQIEHYCRHNPKLLPEKLKTELAKN